jgi:hypothetical protein
MARWRWKTYTAEQIELMKKLYSDGLGSEQISEKFWVTGGVVRRILNRVWFKMRPHNIRGRKHLFDMDFFRSVNTEEKAYWLWFIYADWNVCNRWDTITIALQRRDRPHIQKFADAIWYSEPLRDFESSWKTGKFPSTKICVHCRNMVKDLAEYWVMKRKSSEIRFPRKLSPDLYRHFIRWYFDKI